ncbi:MAG: patatin-like phospholipase family protein, partial [Bacteroidales bacterium]|nr:patatin-like phospholipase family protein [Bacteroidales bacterium]
MEARTAQSPFHPTVIPTAGKRFFAFLLAGFFLLFSAGYGATVADEPASASASVAAAAKPLKSNRPKVGLVLSGGGAKGIAHVGILKIIEELGIPVDYITGTSMGSIIGGLYAYGYSAAELDSILRAADWDVLLSDKAIRSDISLTEKRTADQYVITLPFGQKSSLLPIGILKGQHINNLFYTLTSNTYALNSFVELQIPFRCVATDVLTGQAIVLKDGNLAEAMRASMAIPGVFNPVEKDSMILVDGGLVDNFPVEEILKMGADIVIGVDVGFQYKGKDKLKNMANVLEMSLFMHTKTKIAKNKERCRILVTPDLTGYGPSSFGATDSLLARGEAAARAQYDEFKKLAEELAAYQPVHQKISRYPHLPMENVYVSEIQFEGLS